MIDEKQVSLTLTTDNDIILDEDFDFDGFQVVRGEYFAHVREPSFTFFRDKVSVNTACIKKLSDVEYIQFLINSEKKQLALLPCKESDRDSFRWYTQSGDKRMPRQISSRIFSAKVLSMMDWNPDFKYKLLGKLIDTGKQVIFLFDLTSPEIFITESNDAGDKLSRRASYPAEWQNQFGIPVNEHPSSLKVSIFNGHAVFGVEDTTENAGKEEVPIEQPGDDEAVDMH